MAANKLICVLLLVVFIVLLLEFQTVDSARRNRNEARANRANRNTTARANRANRNRGGGRRANRGNSTRTRGGGRRQSRGPPAGCEEIYLPMCKGLIPYTHTRLPNQFNHTTQLEVYEVLQHKWTYMDHACSKNLRLMLCAQYLPKCSRRGPGLGPCKQTCMRAKSKCAATLNQQMRLEWGSQFPCRGLPTRKCVRATREQRCPAPHPFPSCVSNTPLPMCANLTFNSVTTPNMFQQCHLSEISTELSHFQPLVDTGCHQYLKFLLCGVYSPFCLRGEIPYSFPCQELCIEIRDSCQAHYSRLNHGLAWPAKLQCHRLPASTDENYQCVMPNEGSHTVIGDANATV